VVTKAHYICQKLKQINSKQVKIMRMKFTKMHGLGNDFIVIDGIHQKIKLNKAEIKAWSDRHTGIGFDQCLLIEKSQQDGVDFNYRIFNADGEEVGQCGNGARCMALFLKHYGFTKKSDIRVRTSTTSLRLLIHDNEEVTVEMPQPIFTPEKIPLLVDQQEGSYQINLLGHNVNFYALSVGNPHAVIPVKEISMAAVDTLGQALSIHRIFPEQVNVGFMQIAKNNHLYLRVYERGVGETRACGSGAVAAAVVARRFYGFDDPVSVSLPGGDLKISWPDERANIGLTGTATFVYEGQVMA
jgi:diaminopimelate epimerase